MYPSLFGFKKLTDQREIVTNANNMNNSVAFTESHNEISNRSNQSNQNVYNDYDSASITNNIEEFKSLFKTQENACYELRSENTVLKMKLEVANETIRIQSNRIKSLKMKKNNLKIENNVYKNVLSGSSLSFSNFNNNSHHSKFNNNCLKNDEQLHSAPHPYPPPPPPPLPLPPPNIMSQNKIKVYGNSQMNNVLDELKSKIKQID